jgi:hypothetical protein
LGEEDDDRQSLSSAFLYAVGMTGAGPLRPDLRGSMLRAWRAVASPLVELAVVLFFLVDILGLILEPNTNGGRQLL